MKFDKDLLVGKGGLISFFTVGWICFWSILANSQENHFHACAAIAATSGCCLLLYWIDRIDICICRDKYSMVFGKVIVALSMAAIGVYIWVLGNRAPWRYETGRRVVSMFLLICSIAGFLMSFAGGDGRSASVFGRGSFCNLWDKAFSESNWFKTVVVILVLTVLVFWTVVTPLPVRRFRY